METNYTQLMPLKMKALLFNCVRVRKHTANDYDDVIFRDCFNAVENVARDSPATSKMSMDLKILYKNREKYQNLFLKYT